MWCCYRLNLLAPDGDVETAVHEFSAHVVRAQGGSWIPASARPAGGGIDIWFNLPQLPTEPAFGAYWNAQLAARGLRGQRVPNRN